MADGGRIEGGPGFYRLDAGQGTGKRVSPTPKREASLEATELRCHQNVLKMSSFVPSLLHCLIVLSLTSDHCSPPPRSIMIVSVSILYSNCNDIKGNKMFYRKYLMFIGKRG